MKRIPLTKGQFAIVDDEDYAELSKNKWHLITGRSGSLYASRWRSIYMHRQIMNCPDGTEVDHIDHDGLDNRKSNLRICTRSQNSYNRKPHGKGSKYKGVAFHSIGKKGKRFSVYIAINGKQKYLGIYYDEEEAAAVYREAAKKYHGEYAYQKNCS